MMAMVSQPAPKKLFLLAKEFTEVFHSLNFRSIKVSELSNAYAKHFHRNLSLKSKFNISSFVTLVEEKMPIFDYECQTEQVLLNKRKLFDFLFIPVLEFSNGSVNVSALRQVFKRITGINIDDLSQLFCMERAVDSTNLQSLITVVCKESPRFQSVTDPSTGNIMQLISSDIVRNKPSKIESRQMVPETFEVGRRHLFAEIPISMDTSAPQKFPNPLIKLDGEIPLPSHLLYRPDLNTPHINRINFPPLNRRAMKTETMEDVLKDVNSKLQDVIEELSAKGKFVPVDFIRDVMFQILHTRPTSRKIDWRQVKVMEDYSKLHGRVNELIKVFCLFNPLTSLYELEQALITSEKLNSFEDLHMGPLLKHPFVKRFFNPPNDLEEVPRISEFKLRKHLMTFLSKRRRGETRSTLEEFLDFVEKKEFKESTYHLCVRVTSYSLAVQTNYRFQNYERSSQQRIAKEVEIEGGKLIQYEMEQLSRKLSSHSEESVRRVAHRDTISILEAIFYACQRQFRGFLKAKVDDFMITITRNPALRHMFMIAIYEGAYDAEKYIQKLAEDRGLETCFAVPQSNLFAKREGEVLHKLLSLLKTVPFPVSLDSLVRVEKIVADTFGAPSFDSLGNGSYINFLASHEEAIKTLGGDLIGASSKLSQTQSFGRQLLNIIHQMNAEYKQDEAVVTAVMCNQFGVEAFEDLGCGSVLKLITDFQHSPQQTKLHTSRKYVEPILLNQNKATEYVNRPNIGILGHQAKSDALACLRKAPLLEDLQEWSHWNLIYKPQFGSIETFLDEQEDIYSLEVSPGKLLRIDSNSTVTDFVNSIKPASPNPIKAAGHLVSLIVSRGSIQGISPQLIANHVATSFEKILAESESALAVVTRFVHDCLVRIPLKICISMANELFIEPLRKKASSLAIIDVLKHCKTLDHRRFFQSLGLSIGIKAWADDFKVMMEDGTIQFDTPLSLKLLQPTDMNVSLTKPTESHSEKINSEEPSFSNLTEEANYVEASENSPDTEVRDQQCREIIECIRHDNFGIGVELDDQQRQVAEKQREREGRSLQRLSSELYTKDTHFVLELIQNADDNSYPSNQSTIPSLVFALDNKVITVLNNEVGFSEKNIRAICDVGKSTKGAHRSGYIGQKGIGFKSVFRVSETPEIHSNGFHIRFDASADPIGFILPNWMEEITRPKVELHRQWTTKVILPLKGDQVSTTMANKFNDIQPSLLLFLHRLKRISIEDKTTGNTRQMVRTDKEYGVIEIVHADSTTTDVLERWLVVRRILHKAKQFKPDVEATELAFAFPLPAKLSDIPLAKDLQHQQVFAFLPLRSYGFRFILQGDFDLPSSREDVNSDSPWNQWLREEIPSLFLESLAKIRELQGITDLQAVTLFLQFIPLEGELHDFFHPVSRQILNLIQGTDSLPTDLVPVSPRSQTHIPLFVSSDRDDIATQISWKQPSQLLFVKDKLSFIRENIPQELLSASLNLFYLNSSLLPFVNHSLQYHLGIGDITIQHLIEVAQTALQIYSGDSLDIADRTDPEDYHMEDDDCDDYTSQTSPQTQCRSYKMFVKWIANWLACIHLIIEDATDLCMVNSIEVLKKLPILPLEGGTLESTENTSLFFPPELNKGGDQEYHKYSHILEELKVIDSKLFTEGDDLMQSRVRKVLEFLGVKNLYPVDIIKHHIVPIFTSSRCYAKPPQFLSSYLVYIKECIEQRGTGVIESEIVSLLKDHVVLVTNNGLKAPSKEVIHFSSHYKCDPDLPTLFPDVAWTTVHKMYLNKSPKEAELMFWKRLFIKLGVKKGLYVRRVDESLSENSQQLVALRNKLFRRIPAGACTIRDWQSDEFKQIVTSVDSKNPTDKIGQMSMLAKLLDDSWEEEYAPCMDAKIYDAQNEHFLDAKDASSFKCDVVQLAWVPCSSREDKCLFQGADLYDRVHQIRSLLHMHVPYIGIKLKNSNFIRLLGIRVSTNADEVVSSLQKWSEVSVFSTSIEHMRNVYNYLQRELEDNSKDNSSSIAKFFQEEKPIFVPNKYEIDSKEKTSNVTGTFHSIHSVCWMDPSTVLYLKQKYNRSLPTTLPKVLHLHYSESSDRDPSRLQQVFNGFGVPHTPRVSSYVSLLKHISSLSPVPEPSSVKDFTSIAFHLVSLCAENVSLSSYVYNNLKNARVFPSHDEKWVSLDECLLENDSTDLAKCFRDTEGVHFIRWPTQLTESRKSFRQQDVEKQQVRQEFITICQIPQLSVKATPRVTTYGYTTPEHEIINCLNMWVPLIQQFLFKFCPQTYARLKQECIHEKLQQTQCLSVDFLDCRYSLSHKSDIIEGSSSVPLICTYTTDSAGISVIYIIRSKVTKLRSLLHALLKLFTSSSSAEDAECFKKFLTEELLMDQPSTDEEVKEMLSNVDLSPIPEDDILWNIPHPRYQVEEEVETKSSEGSEYNSFEDDLSTFEPNQPSEDNDESAGLKSWPPRAGVPSHSDPTRKRASNSQFEKQSDSLGPSDVIGEDDLKEIKSKYIDRQTSAGANVQKQSPEDQTNTSTSHEYVADSNKPSRPKRDYVNTEQTSQAPNTEVSLPTDDGKETSNSIVSGRVASAQHSLPTNRKSGSTSDSKEKKQGHAQGWQELQKADLSCSEIDLVDIEELVQSVQKDGSLLIKPLDNLDDDDKALLTKIGRWGEMFVYTLLKKSGKLPDGRKIKTITWINEINESGAPFDLELEVECDQPNTVQKHYIDVKSTSSNDKAWVNASWNELKFAEKQSENYYIYRVYKAGSSSSRVCLVQDLCANLESKQTRFFFLL